MRQYMMLFVVTMLGALAFGSKAESQTLPVAVVTCSGCTSEATLQAQALSYFQTWLGRTPTNYAGLVEPAGGNIYANCGSGSNGGTVVIVLSNALPISDSFFACYHWSSTGGYPVATTAVVPIGATTNVGTIQFDIQTFARSEATGLIKLPVGLTVSSTPENISSWLQNTGLAQVEATSLAWFHMLFNFLQTYEAEYVVVATGAVFPIYSTETITVTDQNGWTAQFLWNPYGTGGVVWTFVDGSIRDPNGNVPSPGEAEPTPGVSLAPPSTARPTAGLTIAYTGGPTIFVIPFDFSSSSLPNGVITVQSLTNNTVGNLSCIDESICPP